MIRLPVDAIINIEPDSNWAVLIVRVIRLFKRARGLADAPHPRCLIDYSPNGFREID